MARNISILLIIMFLFFLFSFGRGGIYVNGSSRVIFVPSDFATIQEAINNASSGDTILVAPGTYQERLIIGKSLSLIGEDRDTTIIDGFDGQTVISIAASTVTIEGMTIQKSVSRPYDTGITVESQREITVSNTNITGAFTGVVLAYCASSIFFSNIITNNTHGIQLLYSNNNIFSNNVVSGNSEGISLYNSNNNAFLGNTLSSNEEGASISLGNRNYFYHNNFIDTVTLSGGSANFWSRGGEGNYWSSYNLTGADADSDGIGDMPFYIDDSNRDDYPLMGVFYEFAVGFNSETNAVNVISNSTITEFKFETGRETGNRMITFAASGDKGTVGFCRMMIPTSLMDYPFLVVDREGEVDASLLDASNQTNAYLYFAYPQENQSVSVISSKSLQLYNELLDAYTKLQEDLDNLNTTYQGLLVNYSTTLQAFSDSFNLLLENFTQLQNSYLALNSSFERNLINQSDKMQNLHNLAYVLAATTGAFLVTTVYLSVCVHGGNKPKAKANGENE